MAMKTEATNSIVHRTLLRCPDESNTRLWIMVNMNNPDLPDETRKHLAHLLKVSETLIPIGSIRPVRKLRELARAGKESIKLLPSKERQAIINREEQKYYDKYSKR